MERLRYLFKLCLPVIHVATTCFSIALSILELHQHVHWAIVDILITRTTDRTLLNNSTQISCVHIYICTNNLMRFSLTVYIVLC